MKGKKLNFRNIEISLNDFTEDNLILNAQAMAAILKTKRVAWIEWALTPYFDSVVKYCTIKKENGSYVHYLNKVDDELLECVNEEGRGFSWQSDHGLLANYIRRKEEHKLPSYCSIILHGFKYAVRNWKTVALRVVPFEEGKVD